MMKLKSHATKKQNQFQQILLKKVACKTQNFYALLAFLLIIATLFIAVSIYGCLIKYRARQNYLLPFQVTNNKLKNVCIDNINQK